MIFIYNFQDFPDLTVIQPQKTIEKQNEPQNIPTTILEKKSSYLFILEILLEVA